MIVLHIILGIILYIAIGSFLDRFLAVRPSYTPNPIGVVFWPIILFAYVFRHPMFVWPQRLAVLLIKKMRERRK